MDNFYTYAYLREDGTPYYIGKGTNGRAYSTNRRISVPKDKSRILFLKQNLTEDEAFKHEKYMIAILGRKDLGTGILQNRTDGGDGPSGAVRSEETRKKISESQKGIPRSEETKKKISNAHKGKTYSEETIKKMSEAQSGEKHNFYGKTHSEETIKRMREAQLGEKNHMYGKTASIKTRQKMSESKRGKKHSEETRMKISESLKARNKTK